MSRGRVFDSFLVCGRDFEAGNMLWARGDKQVWHTLPAFGFSRGRFLISEAVKKYSKGVIWHIDVLKTVRRSKSKNLSRRICYKERGRRRNGGLRYCYQQ